MIIQDQAAFPSKIKDNKNDSLIHNLFVFNKSGVCFYGRNFTDYINVEKNLISPFITALMTFAKEMIGKSFKIIEMEDVKIVIFEKNSLYYSVLCDTLENVTLLDDIISKINKKLTIYLIKNNVNIDAEIIYDSDLNDTIEEVIYDALKNEFSSKKEKNVIKSLKDIKSNDDIEGITLLTDRGKVIYSSFGKANLKTFLKEVEFRVKIYDNSILKLFYTLKDKFVFSEYVLDTYFIMLVFNSKVKFGLAEHYLTQIVNKIRNILSK
ncbi:MAG: hypothetical protein ACW98D_03520 [Promethearchaeota archaeon]|jgi:hypothetical protein